MQWTPDDEAALLATIEESADRLDALIGNLLDMAAVVAALGAPRVPFQSSKVEDTQGIVLNPDEEVQARLELVFTKFRELQSARAVMRFFRAAGLKLPVRPVLGPSPHEVAWREADSARVRSILQNPAYAGAYVYGRRQRDPSRCRPGSHCAATRG